MKHLLEKSIIQLLAQIDNPKSAYQIKKELKKEKDISTHISSVQKAVKRLESKRLIEVYEKKQCRTGLYSKKYILTVNGLLEYLNSEKDDKKVRKTIENYAQFHNYPIFKYWHQITTCFGEQRVLKALHLSLAHVRTREFHRAFSGLKPDIKITIANMDIDDLIVHTFAYHLFVRLRLRRGIVINKEITNIIKRTLETELDIIEKEREFTVEIAKAYNIAI
jgi:predicted Zn-ribbon and HTH transcriptional regulator